MENTKRSQPTRLNLLKLGEKTFRSREVSLFAAVHFFISLSLFLGFPGLGPAVAGAEEYAVPNNGSPYRDLADLEVDQILHLPTGVSVTREQMLDVVSAARVIYIGETHDNLEAHRAQLEVIRGLNQRFPGRIAVGMEMFRRSAQPELDQWHRNLLPEKKFRRIFHQNWGMGYGLYRPIFEYLHQNHIPLIGLKPSRDMEQRFREGDMRGEPFPDIDENDKYHKAYSMALFGGNDTHADVVSKPYRMLLLWEETMAETVARFLNDDHYRGMKLVVLAGGFHVQYGFGIPKRAFRRVPHAYSIILPTVTDIPEGLENREMKMEKVSIPLYSADFGWKLNYVVPPDNKIRLGVFLEELDDGLRVRRVEKNSNAERMGLQPDDRVVAVDGKPVAFVEDLAGHLQTHQPGDAVRITLYRGDRKMELEGTLAVTPSHP